ncbi:E3 ubiquitin-protein ligase RFWD3 [Entomortierella parvispora]|uniref:RING-type E3 ubiquitin transferase n=1 Tax=Entomortierella parvispora TaxID=205924 RepID=A0A9P3HAU0_9FUNG|nr:E3 ubiquitin-protein ligase RFWD3 [Entomortierella parvispora]
MDYYDNHGNEEEAYNDYEEGLAALDHLVAEGHFRGPVGLVYNGGVGVILSQGSNEHESDQHDDSDEHDNEGDGSVHGGEQAEPAREDERQGTPSQDPDFQSQVDVVVLPKQQGRNSVPEPRPKNVETEESTCPICFEAWTNSGPHRMASLKCGHLYGESCIFKWIAQRGQQGGKFKCPECNYLSSRKDIRRIWSRSVVAIDTTEKDEAVARARKEQDARIRLELELKQSRMAHEMLKSEAIKLQQKHDHQRALKRKYRAQVKQLQFANPNMHIQRQFVFRATRVILLSDKNTDAQDPRYLSYRPNEQMLIYSQQRHSMHGIARIFMADGVYDPHSFIPLHAQPIKDVQCFNGEPSCNRSLILTASMDKTLKVTSWTTRQVVVSYKLDVPVWSCCWSTSNPYTMYCSIKGPQTGIATLDLRNPNTPVSMFQQPSSLGHSPIHSMAFIGPHANQNREGVLCGNLEGAFIYNLGSDQESISASQEATIGITQPSSSSVGDQMHKPLRFPGGSCTSVSFDEDSRQWMASYKFLGKEYTQHSRGILSIDQGSEQYNLVSQQQVSGGPPVKGMARTSVFSHQDGSIKMAAGSEGSVFVWQEETSSRRKSIGSALERLPLQSVNGYSQVKGSVRDIKYVSVGHDEYLAALTEKEVQLFRWSELELDSVQDVSEESDDNDPGGGVSNEGIPAKRRLESEDGPHPPQLISPPL